LIVLLWPHMLSLVLETLPVVPLSHSLSG
jgi:hypothetical protein